MKSESREISFCNHLSWSRGRVVRPSLKVVREDAKT
jgi:hypothetical protein